MAWDAAASPTDGKPAPWAVRRGLALAALLLAPALSGCATLERMDYLDRFFDPALRTRSVAAMEPARSPGDPFPVPDGSLQPGSVVSTEPVRSPADDSPATGWGAQPASVVSMEPVRSPGDENTRPASLRAAEPQPGPGSQPALDAEARTRMLVRQNPWLTRFWMELTPAQQQRVERRLRRGKASLASEQAGPAAAWDPMGLADRARLVYGGGAPSERPEPMGTGDGATLAGGP